MSDPFELSEDSLVPAIDLPHLAHLNDAQRKAAEVSNGPMLVLAGAGTGKTRVLTARIAHILFSRQARPNELLAVTFTNKAAHEMRGRVQQVLAAPIEGWWVGTFHALAARILRMHAEVIELKSNFTILDSSDQERLLKQVLDGFFIDDKRWPARVLLGAIQRFKDRGLTPDKVTEAEGANNAEGRIREIYERYQSRLLELNACDFGDLLLHNLTLFAKETSLLQRYQDQFRYILVDEYQDTNIAQYIWLRLLAQGHRNICCVGDDDQSIYSWRGAEIGNILRFEEDFPGASVIRLECNYRSTPHILAAASDLIAHNDGRLGKVLWTEAQDGEKVRLLSVWDGQDEARYVGKEVEALQQSGHSLNEIAVLVRAGFQTREFEDCLMTLGVPYRVVGGPRFYERMEIRDAIAYLRVIAQPNDDLAFERIINKPKRGLGGITLQTLHTYARNERLSLVNAVKSLINTNELRPKVRTILRTLMENFDQWQSQINDLSHVELAATVLEESGYLAMWQSDKSPEAPGRLENLDELITGMEEFENLFEFLEYVSLVMENDSGRSEEKVTLMTLHGAKGLEFETVFLPGWEEGLFPHQRAIDQSGLRGLEEERRLAYVGITRARLRAYILHAANRRIHNRWQSALPSRFIHELPQEHIEYKNKMTRDRIAVRRWKFGSRNNTYQHRPSLISKPVFDERTKFETRLPSRFEIGTRVRHNKFGDGVVTTVNGNKLGIQFDIGRYKKVMNRFVKKV